MSVTLLFGFWLGSNTEKRFCSNARKKNEKKLSVESIRVIRRAAKRPLAADVRSVSDANAAATRPLRGRYAAVKAAATRPPGIGLKPQWTLRRAAKRPLVAAVRSVSDEK